jgi:SAM-dependent methyltransferase
MAARTRFRMQINRGVRSLLASPALYGFAMRVLGGQKFRRWLIENILSPRDGQKIVDIGCGPADILGKLAVAVEYVGLDISEAYIEAARQRYGPRGLFIAGSVKDWALDARTRGADLVLSLGVLHHIDDDEAKKIIRFAYQILNPNGRFIFYEPCYLLWQSRRSVFVMSKDRGQNIRTEQQWKALVADIFPNTVTNIVSNVNRLGYTNIIGQCFKIDNDTLVDRTLDA